MASAATEFRRLASEPSEPTTATAELLAPWVVAASRPFADWYFAEPHIAEEILGEWMLRPTSEVFLGRATVLEEDGGPVGCIIALTGADLAQARAADFATLCRELGSGPEADATVAELLAASHELFPPVAADELYISRVAVDDAQRGRRIGRRLVGHALDVGRQRGLRRCRLDVSADNEGALRAYEAAGLTIETTSPSATSGLTYCSMTATL